jgi:hypothetical protein
VELFAKRLGCPPAVIERLATASERKVIEASLKALLDRR